MLRSPTRAQGSFQTLARAPGSSFHPFNLPLTVDTLFLGHRLVSSSLSVRGEQARRLKSVPEVRMVRKKLGRGRKNRCRFCTKEGCPRPAFVDYKDVQGLKKMCTSQGKLFSRKRSGNCAAFQRAVKDAVKLARYMALLPYVGE